MIPQLHWVHLPAIHLTWLVLALVGLWIVLELRGRDALERFLSPAMQRRLVVRPSTARSLVRVALCGVALLACVGALMRPQSEGRTDTVTSSAFAADVMIVLDVSKSMLAVDVKPNRLAHAKADIGELVRQLPDHRVGLVVFAGRAVLACPLTADHTFFNLVLSGIDTSSVSRGGTRIGEALRAATQGFPPGPGAKLVVLITDGEDHESYPLEAAKVAKGEGVKIIAVGLGSEEGSPIELFDPKTNAKTQLMYDGKPVISRLDGETLRQMTADTGGAYVPAGTSALDLKSIVAQNVTPILRAERDRTARQIPAERFALFVAIALLALGAAVAIGARAGRPL